MTIVTEPVALRGGALFWYVMDTFIVRWAHTNPSMEVVPGEVRWEQETWRDFVGKDRCGTVLCLAGYISNVCGGRWLVTRDEHGGLLVNGEPPRRPILGEMDLLIAEPDDMEVYDRYGVTVTSARARAIRLLGLDHDDFDLFTGANSYSDLVAKGTELFGPRPALTT
ncbi:hypothetical protein AB0I81_30345 [Nonomuraea sp. NPDC050404]|uniref:hypothetical protein n=1 Tax=Nonomuraea sp. NPDC050404 TaxID=3155783 RepID=UPI0033F6F210